MHPEKGRFGLVIGLEGASVVPDDGEYEQSTIFVPAPIAGFACVYVLSVGTENTKESMPNPYRRSELGHPMFSYTND